MQSNPPRLSAGQSGKRRRVDAADRLGDLPDYLLHGILSSLGSRQAVQTSVLSRRWRHLWRDVPCVAIDEREFAGDPWERFEDFADRMLTSIPLETRLDAFRLHLVFGVYSHSRGHATYGRWIRRGLRHFPATVDIRATDGCSFSWEPHLSYSAGAATHPEQPDFSFRGSCAAGFTRRLTTLRLVGVHLAHGFLEDLGRHCPVLEELHVETFWVNFLRSVDSPTLRRLAVVEPQGPNPCAHLRIAAPRIACLRLDIPLDSCQSCSHCGVGVAASVPEPLTSLMEASIRLTETGFHWHFNHRLWEKRKLEVFKSIRSFLDLLPNVTKLHLAGLTTAALLEEGSQEFRVFHSLKTLLLEECDVGLMFQALTSILSNTPNLENLALHHCKFTAPPAKKRMKRGQQPSKCRRSIPHIFWCENLRSIEIKRQQEDAADLAQVLSKISQGMQPAQWRQVKTSTTVVQRAE